MKRRYLWGLVSLVVVVLGAGAIVYASVPHTFATGDTLQAADLNGNFTALDGRITTLEGANTAIRHWDGYLSQAPTGLQASAPSGTMAHFAITPSETGTLVVRAHFSTAVKNQDVSTGADCEVVSQISNSTTPPSLSVASGTLGVSPLYIAGNLPTESGSGTYQWFPQTAERAFSVTAGQAITIYLNGTMNASAGSGCAGVVYFAVSISADFSPSATSMVTVSAN